MLHIRVTRPTWNEIQSDLSRAHPFASERVGFMFGRSEQVSKGQWLTIANEYVPVADSSYVDDIHAGATIDESAIRTAIQHALDTGKSAFHVHRHDHLGVPWLSRIDRVTTREIAAPLLVVAPAVPHGAIVLSRDSAFAVGYFEHGGCPDAGFVSVIGAPSTIRMGVDGR